MPNWCSNSVEVSAKTKEELEEFLTFIRQTHFSHHTGFRTGDVDGDVVGVFWNFKQPEDVISYYAGEVKTEKSTGEDEIVPVIGEDWYNWNIINWGTKWDVDPPDNDEVNIDGVEGVGFSFTWHFDTAWSPAQEAYGLMAERFPNLYFIFEITEEANFYAGKLFYSEGELQNAEWVDSPTHSDFVGLDIPCTLCYETTEECSYCDDCGEAPCQCKEAEEETPQAGKALGVVNSQIR